MTRQSEAWLTRPTDPGGNQDEANGQNGEKLKKKKQGKIERGAQGDRD